MPPTPPEKPPARPATMLKVVYLIGVTVLVFVLPDRMPLPGGGSFPVQPWLVPLAFAGHFLALVRIGVGPADILRALGRLKFLLFFLVLMYALMGGEPPDRKTRIGRLPWFSTAAAPVRPAVAPAAGGEPGRGAGGGHGGGGRRRGGNDGEPGIPVFVHWDAALFAVLICMQISTVILASNLMRLTGKETDLIEGMRGLRFPKLLVYSIDNTLLMLGGIRRRGMAEQGMGEGGGGGGGGGRGGAAERPNLVETFRSLFRGDIGHFSGSVADGLRQSRARMEALHDPDLDPRLIHDISVISGCAFVMMSMKMMKILPGVAFFSGFKLVLLLPLYILANQLTHSGFGATTAGAIMGILGLLQGDGRYGVFEVLKHLAPGVLIDLVWPLLKRLPRSVVITTALGLVAAIARTSTELCLVLLSGAGGDHPEVALWFGGKLVPNMIAGFVSGPVTYFVLREFRDFVPGGGPPAVPAPQPAPAADAPGNPPRPGGGGRGGGGGGRGGGLGGGRGRATT